MMENNVWIIGFPKSGNTWVSYLVSYVLNLPFFDFADLDKKPKQDWVLKNTRGENPWPSLKGFQNVYKSHLYRSFIPVSSDEDLIIYVYRDPRDVYISYKHFMENGLAEWKGRLMYRLVSFLGEKVSIRWFLRKWKSHIYHWLDDATIYINYEQLNNKGAKYLGAQLGKVKSDIDPEKVEEAVELFSFKNMSKGRKKGEENKSSFFRKGIAGDWVNYLDEDENEIFESAINEVNRRTHKELFI